MVPVGEAYAERKNAIASLTRAAPISFGRARAEGSVDPEVAVLAERRARGRDGQLHPPAVAEGEEGSSKASWWC